MIAYYEAPPRPERQITLLLDTFIESEKFKQRVNLQHSTQEA